MLFERVDKGSTTRKGIIGLAIGAVASAVVAAVAYSKSNAEVSGNELINAAELINTAAIKGGVPDHGLESLDDDDHYCHYTVYGWRCYEDDILVFQFKQRKASGK